MTAIAGCFGAPSADYERACSAMLRAQRIYGPLRPAVRTLASATFGRSLAEQLPEDQFDQQPLVAQNRYLLVADIRLDNRDDLLRALNIRTAEDRPRSDADILLSAWARWQDGCLEQIVGDYAFAIADTAQRKLTLVRDPTGQRPLFYARIGDTVAFASMPGGLLSGPLFRTDFRLERFASMLVGVTDTSETTYFEGISRVRAGHSAEFTRDRSVQTAYWRPPAEPLRLTDGGYIDSYHEQLEQAVRARLRRTTGGVGVHLSSGWDSSIVAATAARLAAESRPVAFTSAPRPGFHGPVPFGRIADESRLAALTAEMHGLRHVVVRETDRSLAHLRRHSRLYQEPDRNLVNMEWWEAIHLKARGLGISTLLTGQLGNLTIHAGGLPVLAEWLRTGEWKRWWTEAQAAGRSRSARWQGVFVNSFEESLSPWLLRALNQAFRGAPRLSRQSFVQAHWLDKALKAAPDGQRYPSKGRYQGRLELIRTQDVGVFRKGALAATGVDERDPTADRRLIDFSFALPPEQLLHSGVWRPLARRALAGYIPQAVLDARLRGYQGADWFERFGQAEARAVLEEIAPSAAVNELLDLRKIKQAIDDWPSDGWESLSVRTIHRKRLPSALSTGVFLQEFESAVSAGSGLTS